MPKSPVRPSPPDPSKIASGKPGAVQARLSQWRCGPMHHKPSVQAPASKYILQAGAVIPAALITGLRSDWPGQVTAQVTEDVYDSPTGKILLIPQGARLVGKRLRRGVLR